MLSACDVHYCLEMYKQDGLWRRVPLFLQKADFAGWIAKTNKHPEILSGQVVDSVCLSVASVGDLQLMSVTIEFKVKNVILVEYRCAP